MARGQSAKIEKLSPSRVVDPHWPESMCHVQPPSQSPVVGSPFTLQGQPKSQLQAMRSVPFSEHSAANAMRRPYTSRLLLTNEASR